MSCLLALIGPCFVETDPCNVGFEIPTEFRARKPSTLGPAMAEWFILLLLVPAIVAPVVLLVGFAGCDFQRGSAPQGFQQTLDSDSTGINGDGWAHYTLVLRIEPSAWMVSGLTQVSWLALYLRAPSTGGSAINRIYISRHNPASANLYDSAADLTKVFDVDDPPHTPLIIASDVTVMGQEAMGFDILVVNYPLDLTQPLLIAVDFGLSSAVGSKGLSVRCDRLLETRGVGSEASKPQWGSILHLHSRGGATLPY